MTILVACEASFSIVLAVSSPPLAPSPNTPFTTSFVGRAIARRGDGMGAAANPATRASSRARPTGDVCIHSRRIHSRRLSWVEQSLEPRWHGRSGESSNAGVEPCSTHGGCLHPSPKTPCAMSFVGQAIARATLAWAQRRIRQRGRRAVLDPRGLFASIPRRHHSRRLSWVEHSLDAAMALTQRRVRQRGRRAVLDPRVGASGSDPRNADMTSPDSRRAEGSDACVPPTPKAKSGRS